MVLMPAVYADLTNLTKALDAASKDKTHLAMAGILRQMAGEIQTTAEDLAPKRTGALAASIQVTFNGPLDVIIGPTVHYGPFQEFGTKGPYTIEPRRPGGVLVFEVNGTKVFTKKVTHPGLKARPYMRPAAEQVIRKYTREVGNVGVQIIVAPDRVNNAS